MVVKLLAIMNPLILNHETLPCYTAIIQGAYLNKIFWCKSRVVIYGIWKQATDRSATVNHDHYNSAWSILIQ